MKRKKTNALLLSRDRLIKLRKLIFRKEKDLGDNYRKQASLELDLQKLLSDNPEFTDINNLHKKVQDFILRNLEKLVFLLDYFLSYIVLQEYAKAVSVIPIWLGSFIIASIIALFEYGTGIIKSKLEKNKHVSVTDSENPFLYQDDDEHDSRRIWLHIVSLVFISILPLISLYEMAQELQNISLITALGKESGIEVSSEFTKIAVVIKFGGMALCMLAAHGILLMASDEVSKAKARHLLRKAYNDIQREINNLKDDCIKLENSLLDIGFDYFSDREVHILRFGPIGVPSDNFSPALNRLFNQLRGDYSQEPLMA